MEDASERLLVARGSRLGTDRATDGGGPTLSVLEKCIVLHRGEETGGGGGTGSRKRESGEEECMEIVEDVWTEG